MSPGSTAKVLGGAEVRDRILDDVRRRLAEAGRPPVALATVLVGDDAPSRTYVRSKHHAAEAVGITSIGVELPGSATQSELNATVARLVADPNVHAVLVQLPLPATLDIDETLALIPPEKDVDGLTSASLGRLVRGQPCHVSCTPLGVMRLLEHHSIETAGREAVVVGRSTLVGLPMTILLARRGVDCTVTLCHSRTADLAEVCRRADILITATGAAGSIGADHVKKGAVVIDVGISRTVGGTVGGAVGGIVGDVDLASVSSVASAVTPMPGGTGLTTVACLIENTLEAARMQGVAGIAPRRTPTEHEGART